MIAELTSGGEPRHRVTPPLTNYSLICAGSEVRDRLVRFLTAEGVGGREIHRRVSAVYREHNMSYLRVLEWHNRFREGRVSLQDDGSLGQSHRAVTPAVIVEFDGFIQRYRRIIVEELRRLHRTKTCVTG